MSRRSAVPVTLMLPLLVCAGGCLSTVEFPSYDGGAAAHDAGTTPTDSGSVLDDAGLTPVDAGATPADGGSTPADAGPTPVEAGPALDDAGSTPIDAGLTLDDAGPFEEDGGSTLNDGGGDAEPFDAGAALDGGIDAGDPSSPCAAAPADMACVPAGFFTRGSTNWSEEMPVKQVYVSDFWIDLTEVTVAQWKVCIAAGACATTDSACVGYIDDVGTDQRPMNCVDWQAAADYCAWAGKRLPTEAEFEKASRGIDGRRYPWGEEVISCEYAIYDDGTGGFYTDGCGTGEMWDVGSKPAGASPYGLLDAVGNASEWVADWFADGYDAAAVVDPEGPASGTDKVIRGGAFTYANANNLTATARDPKNPAEGSFLVGFRCAADPE